MNGANSDNAVSIQKMDNQITFTLLHGGKGSRAEFTSLVSAWQRVHLPPCP